jgi:hypothetical protein
MTTQPTTAALAPPPDIASTPVLPPLTGAGDPYELARAQVMLVGYDARWASEMEHYEVLGVEQEFRAPVRNPDTGATSRTWTLAGKLDALVLDRRDGLARIVEHKTTSSDAGPGSDYLKRLRMDGQVTIYYEGAASLGHLVAGCIYDVLVKPGLRPLKATPPEARKYTKTGALYANQRERDETPEEYRVRVAEALLADPNDYFLRANVHRLESEMRDGLADVWQTGRVMRESDLAGRHPRNPDACTRWGRTCEFFTICCGEGSLEDERLFARADRTHAELEADTSSDGLPLLTTSRLSCFRACPRLHKHRYIDGYRPAADAESLRFGHLIHKGLEAWWSAPEGERLEAALAALNAQRT